jgi:hypothetical protein
MKFSSSEDERSITGAYPKELPCSKTGEQGRREEISDGDPGGSGDPDGADGGVLASLGKEFSSGEGERSHLMPLWSSIDGEQRAREGEPKSKLRKGMGDGSRWGTKEIFIAGRMPYYHSNGCRLVSHASNQ